MALGSYRDIFSAATNATLGTMGKVEKNRPAAYRSKYEGTMGNLLDQIVNRENFDYDLANDKLFEQYKQAYTELGEQAMNDTVDTMEGLSGGYGNTYAAPAASEGYQEYLRDMNDIIPELYQVAMNKHAMETADLRNRFAAVGSMDDMLYGRHRDDIADWNKDKDYYLNKYSTEAKNDFYMADLAQKDDQFNRELQYQKDRDAWEERKRQEAALRAAAEKAAKGSAKSGGSGRRGRKNSGGSTETTAPSSGTTHNTMSQADRNYDLVTDSIREEKFGNRQMQRDQAAIDAAVRKAWEEDLKADELREEQRRRRR